MDTDMYSYLIRKCSNKSKGLVDGIESGFEVFRIIVREMDPITKSTKQGLLMQFMNNNSSKCSTLEASRNLVKELDRYIVELFEKTR